MKKKRILRLTGIFLGGMLAFCAVTKGYKAPPPPPTTPSNASQWRASQHKFTGGSYGSVKTEAQKDGQTLTVTWVSRLTFDHEEVAIAVDVEPFSGNKALHSASKKDGVLNGSLTVKREKLDDEYAYYEVTAKGKGLVTGKQKIKIRRGDMRAEKWGTFDRILKKSKK